MTTYNSLSGKILFSDSDPDWDINAIQRLGETLRCKITEMVSPFCVTREGTNCGWDKVLFFEIYSVYVGPIDHFYLTKEEYFQYTLVGYFDKFNVIYADDFLKDLLQN